MHLSNGKTFVMNANNLSDKNIYVQSVELNGKKINDAFLPYSAVSAGAVLTFNMGPEPSKWVTNPQIPIGRFHKCCSHRPVAGQWMTGVIGSDWTGHRPVATTVTMFIYAL
jgi:hypothetical protein